MSFVRFAACELCFEGQCVVGFVIDVLYYGDGCYDGFGNFLPVEVHTGRVCLYDSGVGVYIDYQSGEEVSFSVYEAICVVVGSDQSCRLPHAVCIGDTVVPEMRWQCADAELQYSHSDGAYLVVSDSEYVSVVALYGNQFALLRCVKWIVIVQQYFVYCTGEDPRVEASCGFVLAGFEDDGSHVLIHAVGDGVISVEGKVVADYFDGTDV